MLVTAIVKELTYGGFAVNYRFLNVQLVHSFPTLPCIAQAVRGNCRRGGEEIGLDEVRS